MNKAPVVSVDLIVKKENKILLGKVGDKWSDNGKYEWGLPGREINFGDNFEQSAKKNLEEETGMNLVNFKVISVNENFEFGNHYIVIGILIEAEGEPKIKKPEDWKEWKWFGTNEIPDKLFPSARLTIRCFLEEKVSTD